MVAIQTIAFFLLIGRLISVTFITMVLVRQARLFGKEIDFTLAPNLTKFQKRNVYRIRRVLFALSMIILLGNMVPVLIDTITILGNNSVGRNPEVPAISIMYAFSNSLTAMFSAIMIWALYRLAGLGTEEK